jgi:3-deoxy-7-phosphoheptulonate synthase
MAAGAEYILAHGNPNVLLCERGIRTFETYTRNTLDLAAVAIAKKESHLPVIIDPSQGCGRADLVLDAVQGAVALNADGLLIEVHPNPAEAWSDGQQQVDHRFCTCSRHWAACASSGSVIVT